MIKTPSMGYKKLNPSLHYGYDDNDNNSNEQKTKFELPVHLQKSSSITTPQLDLNKETDRLKTFANWNIPYINPKDLALFGFYYIGPYDMVKCHFCGVEIGHWEEGDNVLIDHRKWYPSCRLILGLNTCNEPISEITLLQKLSELNSSSSSSSQSTTNSQSNIAPAVNLRDVDDDHMYQHELYNNGGWVAVNENSDVPQNEYNGRVSVPEYAIEAKRLESYEDWPLTMKQRPQQLSDAGFFYIGKGDRVTCFSCGGGLKDWEEMDDPWEQHGMWYGNCEYVKLMKGEEFINEMAKKREAMLQGNSTTNETVMEKSAPVLPVKSCSDLSSDNNLTDTKWCKICYANELNTIFLPCGHVIACAKCASSVDKCPACRKPFSQLQRIYFS